MILPLAAAVLWALVIATAAHAIAPMWGVVMVGVIAAALFCHCTSGIGASHD